MPSLHVFPLDNLVLSTGLIMWIDHRKEIRKLTFRELALRGSESAPNYLVILPADGAHSFLETYPFYSCFSSSIFPFCRNKKRHSKKWCQAPFGPNDSLWAKSKKQAGKESGAGAQTSSLPHPPPPRSPHPTPSPHLFPKIFCLPVPSGANCGFVEICFTLVMTFLG